MIPLLTLNKKRKSDLESELRWQSCGGLKGMSNLFPLSAPNQKWWRGADWFLGQDLSNDVSLESVGGKLRWREGIRTPLVVVDQKVGGNIG